MSMTSVEDKILEMLKKHYLLLLFIIFSILGLYLRISCVGFMSADFYLYLNPWAKEISQMSVKEALSTQVGDYNILYQELIILMTHMPFFKGHFMLKYKMLSVIFDYFLAFAASKTVCQVSGNRDMFLPSYVLVIFLPTVFINSSVWAQADSIFTSFGVLAVYYLLRKDYTKAFIFLGISFSFKLQAVFLFPFFAVCCLLFKISFLNFLWVPLVLYCVSIPAFFAGRPLTAPVSIYLNQTIEYKTISSNAANFWALFKHFEDAYTTFNKSAICLTVAVLLFGFYVIIRHKKTSDNDSLLRCCIFSCWTCFMFLPCMHDRYQYLSEIFLVILALTSKSKKDILIIFLAQLSSLLLYLDYLSGVGLSKEIFMILVLCNIVAYFLFAVILGIDNNFEKSV